VGTVSRSGIEKTTFVDPETGREVWRLTNSETMADRHAYYDIDPWSPDLARLVFSSAPVDRIVTPVRDLLSTTDGSIYLMDADTFEISYLTGDAFYQTHNGAYPIWHPNGGEVFYNHASGKVAAVDVRTGDVRFLDGKMRQISPDGTTIVWTENEGDMARRGVYTMSTDGTGARQIVPTERIYELTPNKDQFSVEDVTVGNTKWTADSRHMLLTIWIGLWERPGQFQRPGVERSLYVASRDGSEVRWLTYFGHHHSWTPDAESVLYCGWLDPETKREPRLFLIDFDGTNRRVVIDEPLGGHPIMSPDKTRIATWDDHGIIIVYVEDQRTEYAATFGDGFDMSHRGTHPHPVWRSDGAQLLYNSAQFGHSQLCLLPMA